MKILISQIRFMVHFWFRPLKILSPKFKNSRAKLYLSFLEIVFLVHILHMGSLGFIDPKPPSSCWYIYKVMAPTHNSSNSIFKSFGLIVISIFSFLDALFRWTVFNFPKGCLLSRILCHILDLRWFQGCQIFTFLPRMHRKA